MSSPASSGKYYRFDGLTILVADDNRFVRNILVTIFKALGIGRVIQTENGEEASAILDVSAQMADGRDIDIIFADHLMSPMDGLEFLRWVRGHESDKVKFLPFVMMSGEADIKAVCAARDAGVTEYLAKPMSIMNVANKLLSIIDKPRPFIRTESYFGPDRRRQNLPYEGPDKRVGDAGPVRVVDLGDQTVIEDAPAGGDEFVIDADPAEGRADG